MLVESLVPLRSSVREWKSSAELDPLSQKCPASDDQTLHFSAETVPSHETAARSANSSRRNAPPDSESSSACHLPLQPPLRNGSRDREQRVRTAQSGSRPGAQSSSPQQPMSRLDYWRAATAGSHAGSLPPVVGPPACNRPRTPDSLATWQTQRMRISQPARTRSNAELHHHNLAAAESLQPDPSVTPSTCPRCTNTSCSRCSGALSSRVAGSTEPRPMTASRASEVRHAAATSASSALEGAIEPGSELSSDKSTNGPPSQEAAESSWEVQRVQASTGGVPETSGTVSMEMLESSPRCTSGRYGPDSVHRAVREVARSRATVLSCPEGLAEVQLAQSERTNADNDVATLDQAGNSRTCPARAQVGTTPALTHSSACSTSYTQRPTSRLSFLPGYSLPSSQPGYTSGAPVQLGHASVAKPPMPLRPPSRQPSDCSTVSSTSPQSGSGSPLGAATRAKSGFERRTASLAEASQPQGALERYLSLPESSAHVGSDGQSSSGGTPPVGASSMAPRNSPVTSPGDAGVFGWAARKRMESRSSLLRRSSM